jgi:hypothetical protein
MSLDSNMSFTPMINIDGKVTLSVALDCDEGDYFERSDARDIAHNAGEIVYHSAEKNLIRNGENHMLMEGSCRITFQDINNESGDFDQVVSDYQDWLAADTPNATAYTVRQDILVEYEVSYDQLHWSTLKGSISPVSDKARIDVSAGSAFACFMRVDDEPEAWTVRFKDIPAGTESVIDKQGNSCYVFFSQDVTKDGVTLEAYHYYKLSSGDITVVAESDTKVIRLYRD